MAPPALVNLDNYSDVSFRDTYIRHQNQVAPSANIIQKLYHHVTGNTANLSAADVVSVDGSGQGQWDLMLSTAAKRLDANTINTATTAAWSANSIISVREATTTIRSTTVAVNNLTVAGNASHSSLNVSGLSNFNGTVFQRFQRILSGALDSMVEICEVQITNSPFTVELDITDEELVTKKYLFGVHQEANTGNQFQRLLPLSATDNGKIHVEMRLGVLSTSRVLFRLVRTQLKVGLGSSWPVDCHFKICHDPAFPVIFHALSGTSTVTPATAIYSGTALTQVNGRVGINKADPAFPLDVVGAANVSGNVTAEHVSATSLTGILNTVAQTNITSVGNLSTLTVTGNMGAGSVGAGNLTVNTGGLAKLDNCLIRSFRRTLTNTVGSSIEICDIICGNTGAYVAELRVVQAETLSGTVSKMYRFSIAGQAVGTGAAGTWNRLVPLTSARASDVIVEIGHQHGAVSVTRLRLVRINTGDANGMECTLTVFQSGATGIGITGVSGTASGVTPSTIIFQNTLIAQVSGNVGIGTDTPTRPLDVVGAINTNAAYQLGGTQVLSGSTLGSSIVNSSLTNVGTLGSLNVSGNALLANQSFRNFTKTLSAVQNAFSHICDITGSNAYGFDLTVAQSVTSASISKYYSGTMSIGPTTGIWTRLVPLSSSGNFITRDWAVDMFVQQSNVQLRLVRTDTTGASNNVGFSCSLYIRNSVNPVVITDNVSVGEGATSVGVYENTLITQVDGRVGVGTDSPIAPLDVTGNINSTGSLLMNNAPVLSATALGPGVLSSSLTSVGTLGSLNVTGNIVADGNAFVYNASTNRVGINYANQNPAHRLDVNGDINASVYRINGAVALESDRLGTGVVSSSLTSVGNLTTLHVTGMSNLQNMTVAGDTVFSGTNIDFGTYKSISLQRSMTSTTLGAGVAGGGVVGGAYKAVVCLLQDEDVNNRIAKSYEFVIDKWSSNGGVRERAIPRESGFIDTTADYNDLGLDVAIISGSLNFAVVRTRTGLNCSGNNITVAITAYYPKDQPVTFLADSDQLSEFLAPALYRGNQLTLRSSQSDGGVGIGTDSPTVGTKLDVNGMIYGRGPVISEESYVGKGFFIPAEAGSGSTGINFGNVWRIWFNNGTGNLEIHKNNSPGTSGIDWGENYTVTAILAAQ